MQLREQCFLLSFMPKLACRSWICLQILFSSLCYVSSLLNFSANWIIGKRCTRKRPYFCSFISHVLWRTLYRLPVGVGAGWIEDTVYIHRLVVDHFAARDRYRHHSAHLRHFRIIWHRQHAVPWQGFLKVLVSVDAATGILAVRVG